MKKIRITNMVWTDRKAVSKALVRRNYIARFFDERQCRMCEYRNLRYSEEFCRPCPAYGGATKLYGIKEVNGTKYVGLPLGHSKKRLVEKAGIHPKVLRMPAIDSRVAPKQRYPVSFTGELFDYQVGPVKTWLEKRWGIVEAPPRTGKTVMCIYIACKLGLRTLILADQVDLLRQFMKDFDSFTDHKDASFAAGRPLVGIVKNDEDYLKYDIALSTYQRLNVNRKRLKKIVRRYGLVVIDEVHGASAQGFSEVANSFHSRYRLGVSATVDRKDGRHCLPYDSQVTTEIGPVRIGDLVQGKSSATKALSFNHTTGEKELRSIIERHDNGVAHTMLRIRHQHGELLCTPDHEVWSVSRKMYVRADQLLVGELVEVRD